MYVKFSIVSLVALSQFAFATSIPLNTLKRVSVQSLKENYLDNKKHEKVEKLMKTFEDRFSPLVARQGGKLYLVLDWESDRVIAQALRPVPSDWEIVLHGGATRAPELGASELSLMLCHELGHHLGGTPTASRGGWSSCEGQADYWSSFECIKSFSDVLRDTVVSDEAQVWCEKHFLGADDTCVKFAQTALNVTRFYNQFQQGNYPNFEVTDSNVPTRTFFGHPSPQCRLDTLMSGYLLNERPFCWYRE